MDKKITLNSGELTQNQLNELLGSLKGELFYFDQNKTLKYYKQPVDMVYKVPELGQSIDELGLKNAQTAWKKLKNGAQVVEFPAENNSLHRFYVDRYTKIVDKQQKMAGMLRQIEDIYPLVEYYLKQTGQKLSNDPDNSNGENFKEKDQIDTETGASEFQ